MTTILTKPGYNSRAKRDADFWNKWVQREINAWTEHYAGQRLRRREHELRRITLRVNDGRNQCLSPSAWMALADRIAN